MDDSIITNGTDELAEASGSAPIKRGNRACTSCRKGKNRCTTTEGSDTCDRCRKYRLECVFDKAPRVNAHDALGQKVSDFETQVQTLQATAASMDNKLDAILTHLRLTVPNLAPDQDIAVDPDLATFPNLKRSHNDFTAPSTSKRSRNDRGPPIQALQVMLNELQGQTVQTLSMNLPPEVMDLLYAAALIRQNSAGDSTAKELIEKVLLSVNQTR